MTNKPMWLLSKLDRSIGFPLRLQRLLENHKIVNLGDLIEKSEMDLLKLRQFGRMSLRQVKGSLANLGLSLKEEQSQQLRSWGVPKA